MENDGLKKWADDAQKMIDHTSQVDEHISKLKTDLHAIVSERLFEIFPFLPDKMEAHEIRFMGERIQRHLNNLSQELKNFAYSVQSRVEEK